MVHHLSLFDIMVLSGQDISSLPKEDIFHQKFTITSETLRKDGFASWVYAVDVLEGKAYLPDKPEILAEKFLKLGLINKSNKQDLIQGLKMLPTYILACATKNINSMLPKK